MPGHEYNKNMQEINLGGKSATQCDLFPRGPNTKGGRGSQNHLPISLKTDGETLYHHSSYLFTQEAEALASFP